MSKIFQRRIDPNIPNLIKLPWKVMSVQNFPGRLLYTRKIIFINEIITQSKEHEKVFFSN